MPMFLTVKEAANKTGKSPSSIRRVIYPIVNNSKHSDRRHIEPSVEEVMELRLRGENFAWRISEELLRREFPPEAKNDKHDEKIATIKAANASDALIKMLQRELEIKNEQIASQMELVKGLSERVRESNLLIGSLQHRLGLTDGSSRSNNEIVETAAQSRGGERPSPAPKKAKAKKSWLSRFFA